MFGMNIQEVDALTLKGWLDADEAVRTVDVRTPAEVSRGIIAGSEAVPMHLIPVTPPTANEGEKLVIYCRSGVRSAQVCAFLAQNGVDAYNLQGGVIAWVNIGETLVAPEADILAG